MSLKKIAIRGLIVLVIVVALCMFFSETIRTITTAKIKILTPKRGKLVQTVELPAKVEFPGAKSVKMDGAQDVSLLITSVKIQPGSEVEEGDVLFTAEIADFDKNMDQLRNSYNQVADQLSDLERKNRNLRLKRTDNDWAEAYYVLSDARAEELDKRITVDALLVVEGLEIEDDKLPKGASDALKEAYQALEEAQSVLQSAEDAMALVDRYNVDETTRSYIVEQKKHKDQMEGFEDQMVDLNVLRTKLGNVLAPEDGYITEVNVKSGEVFDPKSAVYSFSDKDNMPVLRVNTEETTLNISKGTEVFFEGKKGKDLEAKIASNGLTIGGEKYADVELTEKLIKNMGGSVAILANEITVNVEYKATDSTTLMPSSAVRGGGEERFVYILRQKQSAFGTNSLVTEKMDVTVLAEASGVVSVSEDLSYMQIAYMEDREIAEDTTVMGYVN